MPNWCHNSLRVTGPESSIKKFLDNAKKADAYKVTYDDTDWSAFEHIKLEILMSEAKEHSNTSDNHFCFNGLFPVPLAIQVLPYDQYCLKELRMSNPSVEEFCKKHNVSVSQYEWELENWGVKWGATSSYIGELEESYDGNHTVLIQFDTPWNAPVEFFNKVSKDYPDLLMELDVTYEFEDEDDADSFTFNEHLI